MTRLLLIALLITAGVGLWFGGSFWERNKWDGKYDVLESENKRLKSQNSQIIHDYDQIREAVNIRLGHGDRKAFITPLDAQVAAQVDEIAGVLSDDENERWADYYRLYDWIADNVIPSSDTPLPILPDLPCDLPPELMVWKPDYWRMPAETIEERIGDCEDMALLLASMIMSYTEGDQVCWVVIWTSIDGFGHAAVALPSAGGHLAILDPAGAYSTGLGRYLSVEASVNEWLAEQPTEYELYVSSAFSDTEGKRFASTDAFIEWVTASI